jgi:polyribonucleotide nucleotidyltransferase
MFNVIKKSIKFGEHDLILETGEIARQADGAVKVSYGDTVVLVTAVGRKEAKEGKIFSHSQWIIKKKIMQQEKFQVDFLREKEGQAKKKL